MGKKKGPAWDFFKTKDKGVLCKYCNKEYKVSNVNKMTKHIKKCFKCPDALKKVLELDIKVIKSKVTTGQTAINEQLQIQVSPVSMKPGPKSDSGDLSSWSSMSMSDDISVSGKSTHETPEFQRPTSPTTSLTSSSIVGGGGLLNFLDHMDPQMNESLNQSMAKAIFISGAPLSMVDHPLWIEFFKKIRPAFVPASRYRIASTYLDAQYAEMQNEVTNQLAESKNLHLQCDGWSNVRNESIVNLVISKPEPLFVEFVATKENRHNASYLAELMIKTIDKYGPEKFLVIIGDNAANMQSALAMVKEKYPAIVPLGCLAHLLHLLCGDILGCASVKTFMATVIDVVKTIKNSHLLKALFDRLQLENKSKERVTLKLPGNTRWGSHLFCLQSLQSNKSVLQKMAVSEEADISPDLKRRLLDDAVFWIRVEKMINLMEPIIDLLTQLEGNTPLIHKVYSKLKTLKKTLTEEIPLSPLQKAEEKEIKNKLDKRMKRAISKIHLAADLLSPSSQGCFLEAEELLDAISFICEVGKNMGFKIIDIQKDLADYRDKEGIWRRQFIWEGITSKEDENEVQSLLWWRQLRGTCLLPDVAIRILGAPVTSAATERTFSTFSWIHNKRRNRLTTERAAKITYLSHNWRLLKKEQINKPTTSSNRPEFEDDGEKDSQPLEIASSEESSEEEEVLSLNSDSE